MKSGEVSECLQVHLTNQDIPEKTSHLALYTCFVVITQENPIVLLGVAWNSYFDIYLFTS